MADALNIGTLVGALELEDNTANAFRTFHQNIMSAGARTSQLGDNLATLGSRLQSTGRFVGTVGDRLTFLAIPLALASKQVVQLATDFDRNMTKIVTVAGVAEDTMKEFREEILRMGPEVAKGPIELSNALYNIASVGYRGAEAMDVLEKSARASSVGLGATGDVAQAVVSAMTAYGQENINAAQATDMLLAAVREGGAEADGFAHTLGRVIGTASMVGVGFDELVASVATFTRLGVRADEAVTALRGTMAFLMKPAAQSRDMLLSLGTSIQEVRDKVKKDGLADALIELVRLTEGNEDALGRIVPNVRALAGVLGNTGEQASAYREILQRVKESHGDLDEAFAITSETAAFKFERLKARIQVLSVNFGGPLVDALESVLVAAEPLFGMLEMLVAAFIQLPGPIQTATIALLGVTLLAGPMMSFGGRLLEVIGAIIGPRGLGGLTQYLSSYTTALAANTVAVEASAAAHTILDGVILGTTARQAAQTATVVASVAANGIALKQAGEGIVLASNRGRQAWTAMADELLLTGEVIEQTVTRQRGPLLLYGETIEAVVVKTGNWGRVLRGAGIVGAIIGIGAALYDVAKNWETYIRPFEVWVGFQVKVATAIRDVISAVLEATGVADLFRTAWEEVNNIFGGAIAIMSDIASIVENSIVYAFYTAETAIRRTAETVQRIFIKAWEDLLITLQEWTGFSQGELIGAIGAIGISIVNALPPLRDLMVAIAWLNDNVPTWARSTDDAAAAVKRLADQAKGAALAGREGYGGPVPSSFASMVGPRADSFDVNLLGKAKLDLFGVGEGFDRVTLGARSAQDPLARVREEATKLAKEALAPLSVEQKKLIRDFDLGGKTAGEIAKAMSINEGAVRRLLDADKEAVRSGEKRRDLLREIREAYIPLTAAEQEQATAMLEHGITAAKTAEYLGVSQVAISNLADTLRDTAREQKKTLDDQAKGLLEFSEATSKMAEEAGADFIKMHNEQRKALTEWTSQNREIGLTGTQQTLMRIEIERDAELAKYQFLGGLTKDLEAQINRYYDHQVKLANGTADTIIERMNEMGVYTKAQLREMVSAAERDWQTMSTAVDSTTGQLIFGAEEIYQAWLRWFELLQIINGEVEILERKVRDLEAIASGLDDLGQAIGGDVGDIIRGIGGVVDAWREAILAKAEYAKQPGGVATGAQQAGSLLSGAASIIGATGAGSTQQRAIMGGLAGAGAGAAIGAAFAPATLGLSIAVGALGGLVVGLIRGGMAMTEYEERVRKAAEEMKELRKETLDSFGTFDRFRESASQVGIDVSRLFQTQDPEHFRDVLEEIEERTQRLNRAMQEYGITLADLGERARLFQVGEAAQALLDDYMALTTAGVQSQVAVRGMSGALNEFIGHALRAGIGIPQGLQPIIEQLITMGLLTENNARLMLGMAEQNLPSFDELEAAAKRYGREVAGLGQVAEQIRLGDAATTLAADFDIFTRAGVEMGTIIEMMGDEFREFIQDAIRHGATVPEALRPLAHEMFVAGELVDENGEKLTDFSQIDFAKPLVEAVDELIAKLDELIQKFIDVGNTHVPPITIPWRYGPGEGPEPPEGVPAPDGVPMARGGDFTVTKPTTFLVGEAGIEHASFSGAGFHRSSSDRPAIINWYTDGRLMTRVVVQHLGDELDLHGIGPR